MLQKYYFEKIYKNVIIRHVILAFPFCKVHNPNGISHFIEGKP